jgi:hypothetical protein
VEYHVNVVNFTTTARSVRVCGEDETVRSTVLPRLRLRVRDLFT